MTGITKPNPNGASFIAGVDRTPNPQIALMDDIGALKVAHEVAYSSKAASAVIKATPGVFYGIVCIASSSGVINVYDNASAASGTKLMSVSLTAGTTYLFSGLGIQAALGIYFELVSGTCTAVLLYT